MAGNLDDPDEEFRTLNDILKATTSLTSLELDGFYHVDISTFKAMPHLQCLVLDDARLNDTLCGELAKFVPQLHRLSIWGNRLVSSAGVRALSLTMTKLKKFRLDMIEGKYADIMKELELAKKANRFPSLRHVQSFDEISEYESIDNSGVINSMRLSRLQAYYEMKFEFGRGLDPFLNKM